MAKYVIDIIYEASYHTVVEGDFKDEGEALDAAREEAEMADMKEFHFGKERESKCQCLS